MDKKQEKLKIQLDLPQGADKELDFLKDEAGHATRVDVIKTALHNYHQVLRAASSQPDTSIKVVKADGEVQYIFPSKFLKFSF